MLSTFPIHILLIKVLMCVSIKLFKLLIEWLTCGCMGTWGQGFCSLLPVGILYNLGIREESCISRRDSVEPWTTLT